MTPLSNNQKKGRRKLSPFIAGTVAAGLCCALYAGIFPFYRIGDYVIGLALSAFAGWLVSTMAQGLDTSKPAPTQQKIPETGNAAADAQIRQGQELMHKIRLENDLIPDPVLSKKMDQLDEVAARIFRTVAEHPEQASKLNRLMDYYLPTTLKMLQGYRRMDERNVQGAEADAARKQIEDAMDIVIKACQLQLNALYQDDIMDIATDIDVLETMVRKDGLSQSSFSTGAQAQAHMKEHK